MFTGIIEDLGEIQTLEKEKGNLQLTVKSKLSRELKIDQSVAHNGVCLTVVGLDGDNYTVTAIEETLAKTNLSYLTEGQFVNLERAMIMGTRLDGHLVQGHVDQTGFCESVEKKEGSWLFTFSYDTSSGNLTIEKGSITVNGVSLTVVDSKEDRFSVAIIPYTYEHTTFKQLSKASIVNLEFDVIGKYVSRFMSSRS